MTSRIRSAGRTGILLSLPILLAVAARASAQEPPKVEQKTAAVNYLVREKQAPKDVKDRLATLRAEIKAKKLRFRVGYTTAVDEKLELLAGTRMPADLAERAEKQNRLAVELRQLDLAARDEVARLNPRFRFPELVLGCSASRAAFDWRTLNRVTPVRNQDGCGSCWAFATLGAYEGSFAKRTGVLADVAEQDVLSCSGAGSCGGGWWAFDSIINNGDAREADYPYTATDSTCNNSVSRPYRAVVWGYVKPDGGIPTVDAMKKALCEHGPLAVAVYVSAAFQAYAGGVFDEKITNQGINHGVTLVGWNDTERAWIIKNSWGAGWGNAGYMHIAWDSNNIGSGAAWVDARNPYYILPHKYYELIPNLKPFPEPDPLPHLKPAPHQ